MPLLTTQGCCESFDLAPQWTNNHVSEGKAAEAGEGAHTGHEEVCHGQVHQDVIQMGPELLVLKSTCYGEDINDCSAHKKDEHKC